MKIYSIGKTKNEFEIEELHIEFRLEPNTDWQILQHILKMMVITEYNVDEITNEQKLFEYQRHKRSVITYNNETGMIKYKVKRPTQIKNTNAPAI